MLKNNNIEASCTVVNSGGDCFEFLTHEQKVLVDQGSTLVEYKKGELIAKQGTFTNHIIQIIDGLAKVYYEDSDKFLILRISPTCSLIGLTSIPTDQNIFHYSASAYIDTTVKLISIDVIRKLIQENGKFASTIIDILCKVSIQKNGRFYCLTHRQSSSKLADIILCLAGNIFKTLRFDLALSRKELAELSGMSSEGVMRILKKFQDDGLIRMSGKTFEIIDAEGLMRIRQGQ